MAARVYVLLEAVAGKGDHVARVLRGERGVVLADVLEGPSDVMVVMEAPERQALAMLTMKAIAAVEGMVEGVQLLPAREGGNTGARSAKRGVAG